MPKKSTVKGEVVGQPKPRPKPKTKALSKVEPMSVMAGISTEQLKAALDTQTEQRELIANFISKHLKKGVDYIRIHVVRNCQAEERARGSCTNSKHFSKDILAKPGQEKIFSLFSLSNELIRDTETIQMLEGTKNLVAYKCIVKKVDGTVVAEGRGAAQVGDNRRDVNATIKIAEKRARMDACLALGFSEYFAQDLDDPDYQQQKKAAEEQAANQAVDSTGLPRRPSNAPIDDQERKILAHWLIKRGFDTKTEQLELLRINGIQDPSRMTSKNARDMIVKMQQSAFETPEKTDTLMDDIGSKEDLERALDEAEAQSQAEEEADKLAELEQDPELEVDDDLRAEVQSRAEMIGLNARGQQWLMKRIAGKPWAKWDQLADEQWRRAYDLVMAILDGKLDVDPEYLDGSQPRLDIVDDKVKTKAAEKELAK